MKPLPLPIETPKEFAETLRLNGKCGRPIVFAIGLGFCGKPIGHKEPCGR